MNKVSQIIYVIETNKGKGGTGVYVCNVYTRTTDIYKAIKFHDEASAELVFNMLKFTLKDYQITEHLFMD